MDLYVENEIDKHLAYIIEFKKVKKKIQDIIYEVKQLIKNRHHFSERLRGIEFIYLNRDYVQNMVSLIKSHCKLVEEVEIYLEKCSDFSAVSELLQKNIQDTENLRATLSHHNKHYTYMSDDEPLCEKKDYYFYGSYFQENDFHKYCLDYYCKLSGFIFGNKENVANNIENLLKLYSQKYIHIFGSAGYGKTNLACAICKRHLDRGIPAMLILGSNIRDYSSPQEQIITSLDLKNEYTFKELLFAINALGKAKQEKVPIIIDGLNESVPTAKIWKDAISDIIYDINSFDNLLLITTLRDSYIHQVFGKTSYLEVENSYKIKGFSGYNIKNVINKYFAKYNISTKAQYNQYLFNNPLLLKMFCEANKNSSNTTITQISLYKSFDSYILNLILKISGNDPMRKSNIIQSLGLISKELWNNNARAIPYPDKYVSLIKGNREPFCDSIAHSMMDEGMFFIRNITDNSEEIQFTYDMIGGYCVAKYYLLKNKSENDIKNFIQSDEFNKLIPSDNYHPLAEDILKAFFYLTPSRCGDKPLYEIVPDLPTIIYIANIDILSQGVSERMKLVKFFTSLSLKDSEINMLCEIIYTEMIEQKDFNNAPLLYYCYFNWSNYQRDIYWNERIRTNVWKILELLKYITKESYLKNQTDTERYNHLIFCTLLFSSTDNEIRNSATKSAVIIAQSNSYLILELLKKSISLSDIYILERVVAVLCGVVLRVKDKNFTNECGEYLQNEFLSNTTTNHIIILDYIETIFEFGRYYFEYPYSSEILFRNKNEKWVRDIEYEKNVLAEREYFYMGVDIFDYDFVKYQINSIVRNKSSDLNYIDIFSQLHMRISYHGYLKELYKELEEKVSEEQRYRRDDNMDSRENYLFKYLWTSYYEYLGYLSLNNLFEKENQSRFRVNDIMIDPTFPQLPQRLQLVNDSFLPSYDQNVQDWINSDKSNYFESIYCTTLPDEGDEQWVLLSGYSKQKDDSKYQNQISIFINILAYKSLYALKYIKSDRFYMSSNGIHNIYAGELPWRSNTEEDNEYNYLDNRIIILSKAYSFQSWSNMRTNLCERFPFLDREIALSLKLWFDPSDLSYYFEKEKVTRFIWTYENRFYFIKKSYLQKYINDNNLQVVFHKYIRKHGEFYALDPSYKDIKSIIIFNI